MSILVDTEIEYYLNLKPEEGGIVIDSLVDLDSQIQPASVDLRLGNDFVGISNGIQELQRIQMLAPSSGDPAVQKQLHERLVLDPRKNPNETTYVEQHVPDDEYITVPPMSFLLGTTKERVTLPANIVGRVEGKSSFARLGIAIHSTAGYIDPGFTGQVTLEIYNHAPRPVRLYVGDPVCQIVLEKTNAPAKRPYGHRSRNSKYQGQQGATVSMSHKDYEKG